MMKTKIILTLGCLVLAGVLTASADEVQAPLPKHNLPAATHGGLVIGNCDGETTVEVPGKDGEPLSHADAQKAANLLMKQWQSKHPKADWILADNDNSKLTKKEAPVPSSMLTSKTGEDDKKITAQEGTYGNFTDKDRQLWAAETERLVHRGDELFHGDAALGGRVGMACAMCHPNGSNTHPETYPKFQVQLGRVAFLRDMINWCIENPVKGEALQDNDIRLRALEAYIVAQRKGVPMEYGKH